MQSIFDRKLLDIIFNAIKTYEAKTNLSHCAYRRSFYYLQHSSTSVFGERVLLFNKGDLQQLAIERHNNNKTEPNTLTEESRTTFNIIAYDNFCDCKKSILA